MPRLFEQHEHFQLLSFAMNISVLVSETYCLYSKLWIECVASILRNIRFLAGLLTLQQLTASGFDTVSRNQVGKQTSVVAIFGF
jgi:hypothetical protein